MTNHEQDPLVYSSTLKHEHAYPLVTAIECIAKASYSFTPSKFPN